MIILPLSKRLDKKTNTLSYPETTQMFKNQTISAVVEKIEHAFRYARDHDMDSFVEQMIVAYCKSTGKHTYSSNVYYKLANLEKLMSSLEGADFIDLLDVIVQLSSKIRTYEFRYSEFTSDLNTIMKMNGMDLQIEENRIVRISEPFMQEEIVNPAFLELHNRGFIKAHEALWKAFDFFKSGDNENAILSANKSLEATIDYIMKERKIESEKDKLQNKLIALINNSILPKRYESSFNSLITVLQTTSIIRNRYGGHGTSDESEVNDLYVKYAIDSTASAILFLSRLFTSKEL